GGPLAGEEMGGITT
nr:Chain A, Xanthomonin II [Xanthomonas hortorum ATCC 19865]